MSRKTVIFLFLGCLVLYGAAFQAKALDVTGDWELTMIGGPGGGGPPGGGDTPAMIIKFSFFSDSRAVSYRLSSFWIWISSSFLDFSWHLG